MAAEYTVKAIAVEQPVEAGGWRQGCRAELTPETRAAAAAFQQQAGDTEQRFAEQAAAKAARDLVVDGRRGLLARVLPQGASQKRVARRSPVVLSGRAREAVIHRALIRVQELVDGERIGVDDPFAVEILPDRREVRAVD